MRRNIDLSSDAVAVLLFISRQRLRLYQNIALSEVTEALNYNATRAATACSECVSGGWLLVSRPQGKEPSYSLVATGRRRVVKLGPAVD